MEYMKNYIENKLTPEQRINLIKQLMDVDMIYDEIKTYILDDLEIEVENLVK